MTDAQVETGVDELLAYLSDKGKVSLKDVATAIKVSEDTLQLWVDFLVEERILGMEYKFTKPYIFLNKPLQESDSSKEDLITLDFFRQEFFDSAKKRKVPEETIKDIWKKHLLEAIQRQKEFFLLECKKNPISSTPEETFQIYTQKLLREGGVQ
jgi:hypothetical protein